MAHYRLAELDLSTRIAFALEMLQPIPQREWGRVTELARTYDVSRMFLYDLRDRALEVLADGLLPRRPGPVNFRPIWAHRFSAKVVHSQRWRTGNSC